MHVAAPFHGHASLLVRVGQRVERGQLLARVEAVKLEAAVTAPVGGTVEHVAPTGDVDGGDVLVTVRTTGTSPRSNAGRG